MMIKNDQLETTENGFYIKRVEFIDPHECDPPKEYGNTPEAAENSIWQCECGKQWKVRLNSNDNLYWSQLLLRRRTKKRRV